MQIVYVTQLGKKECQCLFRDADKRTQVNLVNNKANIFINRVQISHFLIISSKTLSYLSGTLCFVIWFYKATTET